jgi:hypothetical protein
MPSSADEVGPVLDNFYAIDGSTSQRVKYFDILSSLAELDRLRTREPSHVRYMLSEIIYGVSDRRDY